MRTKISFHRNENKYIKSSFGRLRTPVDRAIVIFGILLYFFLVSSKACIHVLGFFNQSYDFSRKSP